MTPQDWQRVKELCGLILEQPPDQRMAFLARACPDDERIRREVEALMVHASVNEGILDAPVWQAIGGVAVADTLVGTPAPARTAAGIPATLGPYRVLQLIGQGGMGTVYKAEQDRPHRIVALKVIKPGLATDEMLRRFERESDALARLQHPGIARIYEVGSADTGSGPLPYLAMEFINGTPLREYAESRALGTRDRLQLMARVCDAVEHAHQRGIIHRDLKPGNILLDESGQPKILDFGVARVTDSDGHVTRHTDLGQLVGTLAYMSPEQVLANPLELDTRSDVYALGVILYELLATRLPYRLSDKLIEAVRTIQEQDPARLSSIDRAYRGDVETIVAKALEKDKTRRYQSAAALATDIRRYLAHEPIAARRASTAYQLRKFARRHTALVGATAAVFAVLVAGIAVSARAAVQARQAEQTAQAVADFLRNDLLAQASASTQSGPRTKPDPDLKVRTALDRAAARISGKFDRQPAVEAAIRETLGQTYADLALYPEARTHLERALELHRRADGNESPRTLRAVSNLARTAFLQGKYPEAEQLYTQALEVQRRVLGPEQTDTLASMTGLGTVYSYAGKYAQAEAIVERTVEIQRRAFGDDDPGVLRSMSSLQSVYYLQGKYSQAEALADQVVNAERRVLGPEHPSTLSAMNNLGNVYMGQGKYAQAERLYVETLEIHRRVLGSEHASTLLSIQNLANVYGIEGKYGAAEKLFSETLAIQRRVLGREHPDTLHVMANLADAYYLQNKYEGATALFEETLDGMRRVLGPEHPRTLLVLSDVVFMYQRQGRYSVAEGYATQALSGRRHALGANHPSTIESAADLALTYLSQGKFVESEPLAREALEFTRKQQPDDWSRFRAESLLGASLAGQSKYTEAEPLLLEGYMGMAERKDRMGAPYWYYVDRAGDWIVDLYRAWGKADKADAWRRSHASLSASAH